MRYYLIVLLCISWMASDFEHLLLCLSAIFGKNIYSDFLLFKNPFLWLLMLSCRRSLNITLSGVCKHLLPFRRQPFHLADNFLHCIKTFSSMYFHLFISAFASLAWGAILRKILLRPVPKKILSTFSTRSFSLKYI